jgi:D-alanyl-D-alanine-carboxypeptidase/D-alanyl-D-alanine-endopeptidase
MEIRSRSRALLLAAALAAAPPATAEDRLLDEALGFAGAFGYFQSGAPGFVIAAVRDGQTSFAGFGETARGSGKTPDADTIMRVGSVSKVFCGETLASLVVEGKLGFTDRLQDRLGYDVTLPERDGKPIRLIDLVTHSAGLPREVPRPDAPAADPFSTNTREAQIAALAADPLLFAPGTGALYSNFGFDLLGAALANAGGKPYAELLRDRVLGPLGMNDTLSNPRPGDQGRLMQGHNFDGSPMPFAPTPVTIECAGGLYTTANDMMRWMKWQLDRFSPDDQELRLLDQAAYLYRDGLRPAAGFDEAGTMDAIGLAWVVMMPEGDRPLILQKTGGLQGMFAYVALAPMWGVGVFAAMNEFNVGGFEAMVSTVTGLITELAPR